jgi:hypothetical protein
MGSTRVLGLEAVGQNLFARTSAKVWRRPLSEMLTDVKTPSPSIPNHCILEQNYPNPFNPSTTIRYCLPNGCQVTLTVFNTLGQQVTLLQNGEQELGFHEIRFDGKDLSSGVYFYRLRAGDFLETKRFLLLR